MIAGWTNLTELILRAIRTNNELVDNEIHGVPLAQTLETFMALPDDERAAVFFLQKVHYSDLEEH